jgi:hypothetical protein
MTCIVRGEVPCGLEFLIECEVGGFEAAFGIVGVAAGELEQLALKPVETLGGVKNEVEAEDASGLSLVHVHGTVDDCAGALG